MVEPDVLRENRLILDVGEVALQPPVEIVEFVCAGGRERIGAEGVDAVDGARHALREEPVGHRHRGDVACREDFAGVLVRAHVVAGDGQFPPAKLGAGLRLDRGGVEVFQELRLRGKRGERGE